MKVFEWANAWKKESRWPIPFSAEEWRDWMVSNRIQPSMFPEEISQAMLDDPSDNYQEPVEVPFGMNEAIRRYENDYFSDGDYDKHLLEFLNAQLDINVIQSGLQDVRSEKTEHRYEQLKLFTAKQLKQMNRRYTL